MDERNRCDEERLYEADGSILNPTAAERENERRAYVGGYRDALAAAKHKLSSMCSEEALGWWPGGRYKGVRRAWIEVALMELDAHQRDLLGARETHP